MERYPDWEARLAKLIREVETRPYEPGKHDCGLWAAAAIKAQTGVDFGKGLRSKYRTQAGGYRHLRSLDHDGLLAFADAKLGERVGPLQARRGDIVTDGERLGVMWTRGALFVGQGETEGLQHIALGLVAAWRVG